MRKTVVILVLLAFAVSLFAIMGAGAHTICDPASVGYQVESQLEANGSGDQEDALTDALNQVDAAVFGAAGAPNTLC